MKLLLDTHAFLWWLTDDRRLSARAREGIAAQDNTILVSAVTGWEVSTKHRLGRLPQAGAVIARLAEVVQRSGMEALPVGLAHGLRAGSYPADHGDPFDRMLAAQAELEDLTLVTCDPAFANFPVRILW